MNPRVSSASSLFLLLLGLFAACVAPPFRTSEPDPQTQPDARLDIQVVDRLGVGWSIHYLQVFANGWLVWQGVPGRGAGFIARGLPMHSGQRELSVRLKVALADPDAGYIAAERQRFELRPAGQTLQIILDEATFFPEELDIELATR